MFCSGCGEKNVDGARFCNSCGSEMGKVVANQTPQYATPGSYHASAPGQGLLIAAGVLLLICGLIAAVGLWGSMQLMRGGYLASAGRATLEYLLDIPLGFVVFMGVLGTGLFLGLGIEGLVYCGNPAKATMLKVHGVALLVYTILDILIFAPKLGFSFLYLLGPGVAILHLVGAAKNGRVLALEKHESILAPEKVADEVQRDCWESQGLCCYCGGMINWSSLRAGACESCGKTSTLCFSCSNTYDGTMLNCPHCGLRPSP